MKDTLIATLEPESVAVVGASDNPDKIGGRPVHYMKTLGFKGQIYPINPSRRQIQGLPAFASLDDLPEVPDLAVIVVSGDAAVQAVNDCARLKVKAAIVIASGFGEVNEAGKEIQRQMCAIAREAGMRLVGPNSQGFANFANGAVSSFSTMFLEYPPQDGPVAVISQSGALSAMVYGMLRARGVGVRYMLATGNEADVTVADLTRLVVDDPDMKLILLYLETIESPDTLAAAAAVARERNLPIVAIKAGRTDAGQRMAASHTGSLANEDRVVDAFFQRHGIWRVNGPDEMTQSAPMYLQGWQVQGNQLVALSNSGASCVMAADLAHEHHLELAQPSAALSQAIHDVLPAFATSTNPIDLTGAVLQDSSLLGRALTVLAEHSDADCLMIEIPVAGQGYDLPGFAQAASDYARRTNRPVAVAAWQQTVAQPFRERGLPVYETAAQAMGALSQVIQHSALLRQPQTVVSEDAVPPVTLPAGGGSLNEAQSLAVLREAGLPVVEFRLCHSREQAQAALDALGAPVVAKACSADVPHKSDHGLVALNLRDADQVGQTFDESVRKLEALKASNDGVIVAQMHSAGCELLLGAHRDPVFGPVVVLGDGGKYVEALKDSSLLIPPFTAQQAVDALNRLRIAPVLAGVRGEAGADVQAVAVAAVCLGQLMLRQPRITSVDANPVMVRSPGQGVMIVDAMIEVTPQLV